MPKKIKCYYCEGSGEIPVPKIMERSVGVLKKKGPMTVAAFATALQLEISNAHHRLKRMARAGLVKIENNQRPVTYKAT